MNDQSDQQCKFIGVHTASSRGALRVGGVVRKLGSVWGVNISSLNSQKYLYAFGVILRKTKLKFDEQ